MKRSIKKIYISICLLFGAFLSFAQVVPPPPPSGEGGEIGGPATPIDMYGYILFVIVPVIIYYYRRKTNYIKN